MKVDELDPTNPDNNGYKNEDLIVWMRTAALPTFRKLYRRISHNTQQFTEGLPEGEYQFTIEYSILFSIIVQVLNLCMFSPQFTLKSVCDFP